MFQLVALLDKGKYWIWTPEWQPDVGGGTRGPLLLPERNWEQDVTFLLSGTGRTNQCKYSNSFWN